eukprot:CAMPEP_0202059714 /NCGR_PEP_ID=MMETSP0963-20130614/35899_1 /ASSEMBLY_ACC=CAM_ASM_000494 /TAXON_ID=4773 /ORGANISM="Schizochytrium aggregatum, Strain ATCC28209" /LENGTH=95 /DNA_ID=CAMNT_0048625773 /DNA_START=49 /DNA_END=337 /DNA_ORIENTATION=-
MHHLCTSKLMLLEASRSDHAHEGYPLLPTEGGALPLAEAASSRSSAESLTRSPSAVAWALSSRGRLPHDASNASGRVLGITLPEDESRCPSLVSA